MWPHYDDYDLKTVSDILKSGRVNYWTGTSGKEFEKEFTKVFECKYAIALSNGSFALTAAYMSLGLNPGDEIITTPRTFLATASTAVLLGLKVVFADIDKNSGAITSESIEKLITKKTKAITVVHLGGWPAQIDKIVELAKAYNLKVIEDCSQAHGAKFKDINVGNFGDVATWSFCQDKIISTCGEGGMLTTNNKSIKDFVFSIKDHGKNLDLLSGKNIIPGFKYIHESIGTNMRLTEIQSSIGRNQLKKLSVWNKIRERNSMILYENLHDLDLLRVPLPDNEITNAWYRFYVYLRLEYLSDGWSRERILIEVNELGVKIFTGSCGEIYLEKCFKKLGYYPLRRLKNAKELGDTSLAFLVHPTITEELQRQNGEIIRSVIKKATK